MPGRNCLHRTGEGTGALGGSKGWGRGAVLEAALGAVLEEVRAAAGAMGVRVWRNQGQDKGTSANRHQRANSIQFI